MRSSSATSSKANTPNFSIAAVNPFTCDMSKSCAAGPTLRAMILGDICPAAGPLVFHEQRTTIDVQVGAQLAHGRVQRLLRRRACDAPPGKCDLSARRDRRGVSSRHKVAHFPRRSPHAKRSSRAVPDELRSYASGLFIVLDGDHADNFFTHHHGHRQPALGAAAAQLQTQFPQRAFKVTRNVQWLFRANHIFSQAKTKLARGRVVGLTVDRVCRKRDFLPFCSS